MNQALSQQPNIIPFLALLRYTSAGVRANWTNKSCLNEKKSKFINTQNINNNNNNNNNNNYFNLKYIQVFLRDMTVNTIFFYKLSAYHPDVFTDQSRN